MIDRRTFVASGVAGLAQPALARSEVAVASLYGKAIVVDGNLVPPIATLGPLPSEAVVAIRKSGLTAIKADLDGADTFDSVSEMIGDYHSVIASNAALLGQIREIEDIQRCKEAGKLGIIFSFEKVGQLEGKIANIEHFGLLGVRVMQLSYNQASLFASGALTDTAASTGLTDLGREAVDRMNALGITIDLSHSDAKTTKDVLAVSRTPPSSHMPAARLLIHIPATNQTICSETWRQKEGSSASTICHFWLHLPASPQWMITSRICFMRWIYAERIM